MPIVHRSGTVALLVGSLLLTGCASQYGAQKTNVNYYPQCYQPVGQLRQDENSTGKSTAAGAAGGALLGALIGGLATGKVEGALVGAAAGGVGGAVVGHAYGKSQERERDANYMQTYARQLGSEAAGMNRASAAAKVAATCYDQEFKLAAGQFKAGQMTRFDFQQRYTEIRSGLEETALILNNTASTMAQKDGEYQQALAEEYTKAEAVNVQKTSAPGKKRKVADKAEPKSEMTAQAEQWKSSRQDLESTRSDVKNRIDSYDETVNVLLG